jgi:hypothetical protein
MKEGRLCIKVFDIILIEQEIYGIMVVRSDDTWNLKLVKKTMQ